MKEFAKGSHRSGEYDVRVLEDDSIKAAQNKEQRATGLRIRGRRRKTTARRREVDKEQT